MLKIKQKIVSASLCYLLPSVVFAEFPEEGVRQNISSQNTAVQVQQKQWLDILSEEERSSEKNENIGRPTLINDDFLASNPHILEDALVQALNGNRADLVSSLVALYRKQPNHNPKLIARADALLAKLKGRNSEAVERYRTLYESDVSDDRILLDLAAAEFQDHRLGEATMHFRHAAQRDIPAPVLENVKHFQEAIKRQTEWKWSGGISPVHNDNANNAAPRYCIETRGQTACHCMGITPSNSVPTSAAQAIFSTVNRLTTMRSAGLIWDGSARMANKPSAFYRFIRHSWQAAASLTAKKKITVAPRRICWHTVLAYSFRIWSISVTQHNFITRWSATAKTIGKLIVHCATMVGTTVLIFP